MRRFKTRVTANHPVADDTWEMEFGWSGDEEPLAGNFFTLSCSASTDPLLRRPFAFSQFDAHASRSSFIYLKRGKTTSLLSGFAVGAEIDILGPLGKAFRPPDEGKTAILLAGGIGAGPIIFLSESLSALKRRQIFLYGARSASLVPQGHLPAGTLVCTDDGSAGEAGTVIDALRRRELPGDATIYACGPHAMLAAAAEFSSQRGLSCQVSVEQHMACGVGACMGCIVPLRSGGYARSCAEGPVFEASSLAWE